MKNIKTIITGTTNKPMAREQLKNCFQSHEDYEGYYILKF